MMMAAASGDLAHVRPAPRPAGDPRRGRGSAGDGRAPSTWSRLRSAEQRECAN